MLGEGWHWIDGKSYYMYSGGDMAENTWVDGSSVDASGAWVPDVRKPAQWRSYAGRWWYTFRMAAIRKMNGLQSTVHGTISAKTAGCWIKAGTGLTENVTICIPAELSAGTWIGGGTVNACRKIGSR